MEMIDRIEDNIPELTKKESDDLFYKIMRGKDVVEKINTSRGVFKVKFPRAKDLETIGRLTAIRLNGIPSKCFDSASYNLMQEIASLDVLIISGPDWFESAKKSNPNFSWSDIPSQSLINEVYALAYNFRNEIQKKIDANSDTTDRKLDVDENSSESDDKGLFDGLSDN